MKLAKALWLTFLISILPICFNYTLSLAQDTAGQVFILGPQGQHLEQLTDGDSITLQAILPAKAVQPIQVEFRLASSNQILAGCTIQAGNDQCKTLSISTLGWYWDPGEQKMPARTVEGIAVSQNFIPATVMITPRPVVMVHGFISSWEAWKNYLGKDGFLAKVGIKGFAVGDGQVEGLLNTGLITNPAGRTNTIAQNASILGQYIANVKTATRAQQVDLIGHSMGGLISRYYIDQVMKDRDVAQLIMLGSPMHGSECAYLPASLGFYLPATIEIQPSYINNIFNPQVYHRRGVPFHALAGVAIVDPLKAPCTAVPSDIAVSLQSASGLPMDVYQLPMLHTDLNASERVFSQYVLPRLQTPAGQFLAAADEPAPPLTGEPLQFTHIYTGHVAANTNPVIEIPIEPGVTIANFALFDSSQSLTVTVQGASGKVIQLDPEKNGLLQINDPSTMVYLGYGFSKPKPGVWKVMLQPTDHTPPSGADFALTARLQGSAVLSANAIPFLPRVNEPVELSVKLQLADQIIPLSRALAVIHRPDGQIQTLNLAVEGNQASTSWKPSMPGLYTIDLSVSGLSGETPIERITFLSIEAQPASQPDDIIVILLAVACVGSLLAVGGLAVFVWLIRRPK